MDTREIRQGADGDGHRDGGEPPIATLPRQQRTSGAQVAFWQGAAPYGPPALPAGLGFARRAALRERRLGWMLWGGLVMLVLVLSAT